MLSKLPEGLRFYITGQASSLGRYVSQELLLSLCGWIPSLPGIAIRALAYRLIMRVEGFVAIENGVRLSFTENIRLGRSVYLDRGVYLHGCPGGIEIGDHAFVMHNAELHVFNFRRLPHAFIKIGRRTFVGESVVVRGQGGVTIGEAVLIGPCAQILAINHNHGDPSKPIMDQGISGQGIVVEDGAWICAGAIILDGVRVGRGAVVGANSVVTRDVPPRTLVAGSPAEVVKYLDPHETPARPPGDEQPGRLSRQAAALTVASAHANGHRTVSTPRVLPEALQADAPGEHRGFERGT